MDGIDALGYGFLSSRTSRDLQVTVRPPEIEGIYIKGQGVVYSATIPAARDRTKTTRTANLQTTVTCTNCHSASVQGNVEQYLATDAQQLSDWEQERRKLLAGQNSQKETEKRQMRKLAICHPGRVAEVVLQLFMENGRYFL